MTEPLRINVGFPVVVGEGKWRKAHAVYVHTRPGTGLFWDSHKLNSRHPFERDSTLSKEFVKLGAEREIHFESLTLRRGASGTVDLDGDSFWAFHEILSCFDLDFHARSADLRVLVTGFFARERGVVPLEPLEDLRLKGTITKDPATVLLLSEVDYLNLDEHSGKFANREHLYTMPTEVARLKAERDANKETFAMALPNHSDDWDIQTGRWAESLGKILNLRRRFQDAGASSILANALVNQMPDAESEVSITPGTMGELFRKALPTSNSFLRKLQSRNPELFSRKRFPNGVADPAIESESEIFATPYSTPPENILLAGPTGCGKTFLAVTLMLNTILEEGGRALYIAPVRELAEERYYDFLKKFTEIDPSVLGPQDVILSTGEIRENDWRIQAGKFKAVFMVNEKANIFLRPTLQLLAHLNLLAIDELHMLENEGRGGVIDLLIAKAQRERERRRDDPHEHLSGLRIVGISTDRIVKQDSIIKTFSTEVEHGKVLEPIAVSTPFRPVKVEHYAVVHSSKTKHGEQLPVIEFDHEENALLDREQFDVFREEFFAKLSGVDDKNIKRTLPQRKDADIHTNVVQLLNDLSSKFQSILLFVPSVPLGRRIAGELANARPIARGIELENLNALGGGLVSKQKLKGLTELAQKGIYMHNAQLPRAIRIAISNHFRQKIEKGLEFPLILIATETLSYGVNLNAECVIIADLFFPRSTFGSSKDREPQVLTSNEFHNITGRAGRFEMVDSDKNASAMFLVSGRHSENQKAIREALLSYYSRDHQKLLKSHLLLQVDVTKAKRKEIGHLELVSFVSFRSILEALRYMAVGESASVEMIESIFRSTLFGAGLQADGDWAPVRLLIERVLELCAKDGLIEISPLQGHYQITAKAEALIDTGTSYSAVRPMRDWLTMVRSISEHDPVRLPVEILIPALVATPNFWILAAEFCEEARLRQRPDQSTSAANEKECRALMKDELRCLNLSEGMLETLMLHLDRFAADSVVKLRVNKADDLKVAIFYRLTAALLRWVHGRTVEDIEILSQMGVTEENLRSKRNLAGEYPFKERYRDRARWLMIACARYFETEGTLLPEHRRELRKFAERLAYGVSYPGLPMIGAGISRDKILELISEGITAKQIIAKDHKAANFEWGTMEGDLSFEEVQAGVRLYYLRQISELFNTLGSKDDSDGTSELLNLYEANLKEESPVQVGEFLKILLNWGNKSESINVKTRDRDVLEIFARGIDERDRSNKLIFQIMAASDKGAVHGDVDFVVRVPWWGEEVHSSKPEMSACALITLFALTTRDFVKMPQWIEWKKKTSIDRISVATWAEMEINTLVEDIRDVLDRFDEPGI